jgi:hypothetical protein
MKGMVASIRSQPNKSVGNDTRSLDFNIARARIALSLLAMVSLWIDPSTPGGLFELTKVEATTLLTHLAYGITVLTMLSRTVPTATLTTLSNVLDLFFATVISFITQGQSGPSDVFFVFAIIATATRPGLAPLSRPFQPA